MEEAKQEEAAEEREEVEKYSAFGRFFLHRMGPFLMRKPVRVAVVVLTVGTAAAGIAAASQLEAVRSAGRLSGARTGGQQRSDKNCRTSLGLACPTPGL